NQRVHSVLCELGLKQSKYEPCVYTGADSSDVLIVALYVDDMLMFSNNQQRSDELKQELQKRFAMQDLGEARNCIGLEIERDKTKGTVSVSQQSFISELLTRFKMEDARDAK